MGFNNRAQRFTGSIYLDVDSPFNRLDYSILYFYNKMRLSSIKDASGWGGGQIQVRMYIVCWLHTRDITAQNGECSQALQRMQPAGSVEVDERFRDRVHLVHQAADVSEGEVQFSKGKEHLTTMQCNSVPWKQTLFEKVVYS